MQPSPPEITVMCTEFVNGYAVWQAAQSTGVDPLFVRSHIRSLHAMAVSISDHSEAQQSGAVDDQVWLQIAEVRSAYEEMQDAESAAQMTRSLRDCMDGIPELMLLEIDQLLETEITPDMLADFDDESAE